MERAFKNTNSLRGFLFECANLILMRIGGCVSIDELPDNIIVELVDWWKKRTQSQKYTVQLIKDNADSFLNKFAGGNTCFIADDEEDSGIQVHFTKAELEELKKSDDIAIDWDKAIIEPVRKSE